MTRYVVTCDMENGNVEILDKEAQTTITLVNVDYCEGSFSKGEGEAPNVTCIHLRLQDAAISIEPQREA